MKVRSVGGDEKRKTVKVKSAAPSPAQLEEANKFAREFAARRNLITGEDTHVGGQIPKFIDARSGTDVTGVMPPPVGRLTDKVPLYVKELQWDSKSNLPFYIDEKTGDTQYVAQELFHSPRFNPNRGKTSLLQAVAKR